MYIQYTQSGTPTRRNGSSRHASSLRDRVMNERIFRKVRFRFRRSKANSSGREEPKSGQLFSHQKLARQLGTRRYRQACYAVDSTRTTRLCLPSMRPRYRNNDGDGDGCCCEREPCVAAATRQRQVDDDRGVVGRHTQRREQAGASGCLARIHRGPARVPSQRKGLREEDVVDESIGMLANLGGLVRERAAHLVRGHGVRRPAIGPVGVERVVPHTVDAGEAS
mmetsp:Transcript_2093/g.6486  ORF Transcript_2093/g.6486 Transcript_2093/m.6486 type:complete len:223 (+) Transcript_2093:3462-4130(+)